MVAEIAHGCPDPVALPASVRQAPARDQLMVDTQTNPDNPFKLWMLRRG